MRAEYVPLPPPQNVEGLPIYLQNELQRIARLLGGISERHSIGMYLSATSDTIASVSSTPVVIDIFDTVSGSATGIAADGSSSFTFNTELDYTLTFACSLSSSGGGGSAQSTVGVYKNGTLVQGTNHTVTHTSGSHTAAVSITAVGKAVAGDVLDFRVSSSSTSTVTFTNLSAHVVGQLTDV